jgi:uronate dehydrogenase
MPTLSNEGSWAVTGAAGRIGSALRQHLVEAGVALVSLDVAPVTPLGPNDRVVQCDLADFDTLVEAFRGCVGVVHLGGIPDEADFHDLVDSNILGTYHVLEAARRDGLRRVVFASSNRATGSYPVSEPLDASVTPRPDSFYGVSKITGEALCSLYSDKFGLSTIAIRIGSYQETPRMPRELHTWLSHPDALRALTAAMTTDAFHAVFYGVSNNAETWWSLEDGAAVGYRPEDDASLLREASPMDPAALQGGEMAEVDYSLSRMRDGGNSGR